MNNGFYGFPQSKYGTSVIEAKEFDSSGTYVIPNGTKRLWIMLVGGGGGGGSGNRTSSGIVASFGSGGGGGGTINMGYYFVNGLGGPLESNATANAGFSPGSWGRSLIITIGAGGGGGQSITTDSTAGNNGLSGGASTISVSGTPGFMIYSRGGGGGGGQSSTGSGGGTAGSGEGIMINGIPTSANTTVGSATSAIPTPNYNVLNLFSTGGAAGGGIDISDIGSTGGSLIMNNLTTVATISNLLYAKGETIKSGGSPNTTTSVPFIPATVQGAYSPGLGGAGGGAGVITNANNGSHGYRGGGGGAGGNSRNGFDSGAGGNGGNGYCVIVALGM